jgi:TPR repeat protein
MLHLISSINVAFNFFYYLISGPGISKAAVNLGNIHRIGVENIPVDLVKARAYFAAFADRDELCATLMRETDEEIIASQNK